MKIDQSTLGFTSKESSTKAAAPSLPSATMMQFAHYLGLPSVSERAKSLSTKVSGAASRVLNRKPASVQAPRASRTELLGPAIFATPENLGVAVSSTSNVKQAIAAERARTARILAAGIKAGQVHAACTFACDTDMSAEQAIAAINAGTLDTAAQTGNGRRRMGLDPDQPAGGTENRAPTAKETAARIVAAGERARTGDTSPRASRTTSSANRIVAAGERAHSGK